MRGFPCKILGIRTRLTKRAVVVGLKGEGEDGKGWEWERGGRGVGEGWERWRVGGEGRGRARSCACCIVFHCLALSCRLRARGSR